jgi:transposase-like protein
MSAIARATCSRRASGLSSLGRLAGMGRQTLRDWVYRYNAGGLTGLGDSQKERCPKPRRSAAQEAQLAELVRGGLDVSMHGVVHRREVPREPVGRAKPVKPPKAQGVFSAQDFRRLRWRSSNRWVQRTQGPRPIPATMRHPARLARARMFVPTAVAGARRATRNA